MALALRRVALVDRDLAARVDAHGDDAVAGLVFQRHQYVRGDAGELGAAGEADAEVVPFRARLRLQRAEAGKIDRSQQRVPRLHVVAAVVVDTGHAGEREVGNQVPALEFARLNAEPARQHVEGAFQREARRQRAERARRAEARLVGDGAAELDVGMADRVGVRQHDRAERRHDEAPVDALAPVAHVGDATIAEREDAPLPVRRDFEIVDLVALLAHRHQVLLARLDPAHRAPQLACEMTDHDVLAVEGRLDAEAAALIAWRDHPDLGGRELQQVGEREPLDVGALRRQVKGQPVGIAPDRERAPGLDGADAAALGAEALLEHHIGRGEQRCDFGVVPGDRLGVEAAGKAGAENLVAVPIGVDAGRVVLQRGFGVGDDGERLVFDFHGGRRVLGHVLVLRHNGGERLAVPVRLVHRERPVLPVVGGKGGDQDRDSLALHLLREFGAGDRADHPRHRKRPLELDVPYLRVRVVRPDEAEVQAIGDAKVGKVRALAGQQARVLAPLQRAADPAGLAGCGLAGCGHGVPSVSAGGGAGFSPWRIAEAARMASTMWL